METPIILHGEIIQISHGRTNRSLNKASIIMVEETGLAIASLFHHLLSNRQRILNRAILAWQL